MSISHLPSWQSVTATPEYEEASLENKLQTFYNWKGAHSDAFGSDLSNIDYSLANDFYNVAKMNELQLIRDVANGEETEWNLNDAQNRFHSYQLADAQTQERRTRKTWYLENSFNQLGAGINPLDQRKPPKSTTTQIRKWFGKDLGLPGINADKEREYEPGSDQDFEDGYFYYDEGKRTSVSLSKKAREWYKNQIESSKDGSYSWVARDIGSFGDNKEINHFRSILGVDEYSDGLSQSDVLDTEDKIEALRNYPKARGLTISRLKGYLTSRNKEFTYKKENPVTPEKDGWGAYLIEAMASAPAAGMGPTIPVYKDSIYPATGTDPEIYTRNAPIFSLSDENSFFLKNIRKNKALEDPTFFTDPEKFKSLVGGDLPADFLMDYFLPKVGMEDVVNEIRSEGPKSEVYRDSVNQLFFDALLEIPEAWAEDQTVIERDGDLIVNPNLYNSANAHWQSWWSPKPALTPEQFDERLKEAGMSEEERAIHVNISEGIQEESAHQQHLALLGGIGVAKSLEIDTEEEGIMDRIGENILTPMSRTYRVYLSKKITEFNRKGETPTYKQLIQGFQEQLEEPTNLGLDGETDWAGKFGEFLGYAGRSKTPIGIVGQFLQSMDDWDTVQGVGMGLQKFEEAAVRELPLFGAGIYGALETIFTDRDDTLRGISEFQGMLERQRQASGYPSAAKWGNIFGREIAFVAATMLGPGKGFSRMISAGVTKGLAEDAPKVAFRSLTKMPTLGKAWHGVAGLERRAFSKIKGRLGLDTVSKVGNLPRKTSLTVTADGQSVWAGFKSTAAKEGYMTSQALRSGEAMYRESFIAHKDRLLEEGYALEDAHNFAKTLAIPTGILGSAMTRTLMAVIPGGTERIFEKGLNKLTKNQLLKELNITDDVFRQQLADTSFRKQVGHLMEDFLKVPNLSRRATGRVIRGGKHMVRESVEETIDEVFQGIIAMTTYDPDMTMEDVFSHAWDAAIAGGIMGGTMGAIASTPQEGVQGLSSSQRAQLIELQKRSKELRENPSTLLTSEALEQAAETLNAQYSTEASEVRGEEATPLEGEDVAGSSSNRNPSQGETIYYHHRDQINEDGSYSILEGTYELISVDGRVTPVVRDPSSGELTPLRETLAFTPDRGVLEANTSTDSNVARMAGFQDQLFKLFDEQQQGKIDEKTFIEGYNAIIDEGTKAFGGDARSLVVWQGLVSNMARRSPIKLDPLKGVEGIAGALVKWAGDPLSKESRRSIPTTREDFANFLLGNWTTTEKGQDINIVEGLFKDINDTTEFLPGYLMSALDMAFGAISIMNIINKRVEVSEESGPDLKTYEKNVRGALQKLQKALNESTKRPNVSGKNSKNSGVFNAIKSFYTDINKYFRSYTWNAVNDDGSLPGGIDLNNTGEFYSARLQGFLQEYRNPEQTGATPGFQLPAFTKRDLGSNVDIAKLEDKPDYLHSLLYSPERVGRGLAPGQYISDLVNQQGVENFQAVFEFLDGIQNVLEQTPEVDEDVHTFYDADQESIQMVSFKSFLDKYKVEASEGSVPVVPEGALRQVYTEYVLDRLGRGADISLISAAVESEFEEDEDSGSGVIIDSHQEFVTKARKVVRDSWNYYNPEDPDSSPIKMAEEAGSPTAVLDEFVEELGFSEGYQEQSKGTGSDPAQNEDDLLDIWVSESNRLLESMKIEAGNRFEAQDDPNYTQEAYDNEIKAIEAEQKALEELAEEALERGTEEDTGVLTGTDIGAFTWPMDGVRTGAGTEEVTEEDPLVPTATPEMEALAEAMVALERAQEETAIDWYKMVKLGKTNPQKLSAEEAKQREAEAQQALREALLKASRARQSYDNKTSENRKPRKPKRQKSDVNADVAETRQEQELDKTTVEIYAYVRSLAKNFTDSETAKDDIIKAVDALIKGVEGQDQTPEIIRTVEVANEVKDLFKDRNNITKEELENFKENQLPSSVTAGKFTGDALAGLGRQLVDTRVEDGENVGVYIAFGDFTVKDSSGVSRTGTLRKGTSLSRTEKSPQNFGRNEAEQSSERFDTRGGELGVLNKVNELIHIKYPLKPSEGEYFTEPHLTSLPSRIRAHANKTDNTKEGELMDKDGNLVLQSKVASKFALVTTTVPTSRGKNVFDKEVVFSNSPMHMAVGLDYLMSKRKTASIPVPDSFKGENAKDLNPALILDKDGNNVIGAKIFFEEKGGLVTIGAQEGMSQLSKTHEKNTDEEVSERSTDSNKLIRNEELVAKLNDIEKSPTDEEWGFTEEEINWIWEGISQYEDEARIDIRSKKFGLQYVVQKTITESKEIRENPKGFDPRAALTRSFLSLLKGRFAVYAQAEGLLTDEGNVIPGKEPDLKELYENVFSEKVSWRSYLDKDLFELLELSSAKGDITKLFGKGSKEKYPSIQEHSFNQFYLDEIGQGGGKKGAGEVGWKKGMDVVNTGGMSSEQADFVYNQVEKQEESPEAFDEEADFQSRFDEQGSLPDLNPTRDTAEAPRPSTPNKTIQFAKQEESYLSKTGLTAKSRKRQLQNMAAERKFLGIKSGDSSTIITALNNIIEGSSGKRPRYPKWFGQEARRLLSMKDRLRLDDLDFLVEASYDYAGAYFSPKPDRSGAILLSTRVLDPTNHTAGALLHELEHRLLDEIIDNPKTEEEKLFAEEILPLYLSRSRGLFERFTLSRNLTKQTAYIHANVSVSNWTQKDKRAYLERSKSNFAAEYDPAMSIEEVDGILLEVLEEDYKGRQDTADMREMAYILGASIIINGRVEDYSMNPFTEEQRSEKDVLKEFLRGIKGSEVMQGFLRDLDAESAGGSVYTKLLRTFWYAKNRGNPNRAQLEIEAAINDLVSGTQTFNKARLEAVKEKLGTTKEEESRKATYPSSSPAAQSSIPNMDLNVVGQAIPGTSTAPNLGGRVVPGGNVESWMLPNGKFLQTQINETADIVAGRAFSSAPKFVNPDEDNIVDTSEALAFRSDWVKIKIGRDDFGTKTLTYSSAKPLGSMAPRIQ